MITNKIFKNIYVTGDLNISTKRPAKRIGDNYYLTVMKKLDFILDHIGDDDLLIVSGDLSNKKFDVKVLSDLISKFQDKNVVLLPTSNILDSKGSISKHTCASLLDQSGIVKLLDIGDQLDLKVDINGSSKKITLITDFKNYTADKEAIAISNNSINDVEDFEMVISNCGNEEYVNPGVVGRIKPVIEHSSPSFIVINSEKYVSSIEIPHEKFVFEDRGISPKRMEKSYFVNVLDDVTKNDQILPSVDEVTENIMRQKNSSGRVWEIIDELKVKSV